MDLAGLDPLHRLSLVPWLPDFDLDRLPTEEQDILHRVAGWLNVEPLEAAVALQTPFAALRVPAIVDTPACQPPSPTFWQSMPYALSGREQPVVAAALDEWQKAVAQLPLQLPLSANRCYCWLYGLAQSHLRCLAIDSNRPDISLIDQCHLMSALVANIWTAKEQKASEDAFALLVVDLSGIQSYLFGIADIGVGGVARSLRARSFFLMQIATLFAWSLLDRLGLPPSNLLLDAGGKFFLLFSPTPAACAAVEAAQQEADCWCLSELNGELALNVAYAPFTATALQEGQFSAVWQAASRATAQAKQRRLAHVLQTERGWDAEVFLRAYPFGESGPCLACRKFRRAAGEEKCTLCLRDEDIGRRLTRAQWLAYDRGEADAQHPIGAFGWRVALGGQEAPPDEADWIVYLDPPHNAESSPAPVHVVARYVPRDPDGVTPRTFEMIAASAKGRPYLGYLKADIDRLGERFIFGFKREDGPSLDSPLRLIHLSRALDAYFGGWLEETVRDEYPDCYIVFSGGDDLTVIGPHDQIVRLAQKMQGSFRHFLGYTSGSPEETDVLTVSAGMVFIPYKCPVAAAMRMAEEALDQAKQDGRNAIHLFRTTLSWGDFDSLVGQLMQSDGHPATGWGEEILDPHRTSSAFLYHLLRYARMWEAYRKGDRSGLRYQPLLAYEIARNLDINRTPHVYRWASWLAQIQVTEGAQWQAEMDRLGVLTRLALLQRMGGKTDG